MLELHKVPGEVIGCFGKPAALDQLDKAAELSVRVAADELLLLSMEVEYHVSASPPQQISEVEAQLRAMDGGSLVLDLSSGYAIWALRGDSRFEAFSRLSALKLPAGDGDVLPAAVQGLVAHVPTKVIVGSEGLLLIVPSVVSHHLRERVLQACSDLAPTEGSDSQTKEVSMEEGAAV